MNVVKKPLAISNKQCLSASTVYWKHVNVRAHPYTCIYTLVAPPPLHWELARSITVTWAGVSMLPRNPGKGNKIGERVPAGRWWITRQNAPLSKWVSHFAITGRSYSTLASPIFPTQLSPIHSTHNVQRELCSVILEGTSRMNIHVH